MVEYHCNICSFNTSIKPHYERHLKTKKHLGKLKELEEQKKEEEPKCQPLSTLCQPNVNLCQPLVKQYHCSFCDKQFNTRQAKSKHQKICLSPFSRRKKMASIVQIEADIDSIKEDIANGKYVRAPELPTLQKKLDYARNKKIFAVDLP